MFEGPLSKMSLKRRLKRRDGPLNKRSFKKAFDDV